MTRRKFKVTCTLVCEVTVEPWEGDLCGDDNCMVCTPATQVATVIDIADQLGNWTEEQTSVEKL